MISPLPFPRFYPLFGLAQTSPETGFLAHVTVKYGNGATKLMGRIEVYDVKGRRLPFDVVAAFSPLLYEALCKVAWARDDDVLDALSRFRSVYGGSPPCKVEDGKIILEVHDKTVVTFVPPAEGRESWEVAVTLPFDFSDPATTVEHLLTLLNRIAVKTVRLEGTLSRLQEKIYFLEKKVTEEEEE